ncbi:MAG: hypothetical protein OXU20_28060 [Myxococcales bacterium]|nr:hypothetical protein [Myxococcales bacterium]MDD9965975.1 hypothetical protein [Myxococcales bacterium]
MQSRVGLSLVILFVSAGCWLPERASGQQLGMLIERVARGLTDSSATRAREEALTAQREYGWLIPAPPPEPGLMRFVRTVSDARVARAGPASLRLGLLPCPAELRHEVRDPADVVSVIGAIDLLLAGERLELYLGLGVGPGASYAAPSMTVNGQSGIAARMALGLNLELLPGFAFGAGINAVGLFRGQRDVWATLAKDSELLGSTILPVHVNLRLSI